MFLSLSDYLNETRKIISQGKFLHVYQQVLHWLKSLQQKRAY